MTSLVEVEWREEKNDVDSGALEIVLVMREIMFIIKLIFFIFSFLRLISDISWKSLAKTTVLSSF